MKYELLFSGIGGQGVITLGETLCDAAIKAGFNVTFVPFYGQEKRGGRTMCNIVISDGVESPIISAADIMLIFDEKSLGDYQQLVAADGTLILNSSMIDIEPASRRSPSMPSLRNWAIPRPPMWWLWDMWPRCCP